jgi:hypothetical protein
MLFFERSYDGNKSATMYFQHWKKHGWLFYLDERLFEPTVNRRIMRPAAEQWYRYDDGPLRQNWLNNKPNPSFNQDSYHPRLLEYYRGAVDVADEFVRADEVPAVEFGYWLEIAYRISYMPGLLHEVVAAKEEDWDDIGDIRQDSWSRFTTLRQEFMPHVRDRCIGIPDLGAFYFEDRRDAMLFKLYV